MAIKPAISIFYKMEINFRKKIEKGIWETISIDSIAGAGGIEIAFNVQKRLMNIVLS